MNLGRNYFSWQPTVAYTFIFGEKLDVSGRFRYIHAESAACTREPEPIGTAATSASATRTPEPERAATPTRPAALSPTAAAEPLNRHARRRLEALARAAQRRAA